MRIYQGFPIPMPQDIKDIFEQTLISIIQKIAERLLIETRMYAPLGYLSLQPEDIKEYAQLQRIQDLLETEHESTTRVLEDRQEALRLVRASHEWAQETGKYLYPELSGRLDAQDFVLEAQRYAVPTTVGVFSVNAVLKKLQELDQKKVRKPGAAEPTGSRFRTFLHTEPMQTVLLPKRAAGMSILGNTRGDPGTVTALLLPTTAPRTLELALAEVTAEVLTVAAEALAGRRRKLLDLTQSSAIIETLNVRLYFARFS